MAQKQHFMRFLKDKTKIKRSKNKNRNKYMYICIYIYFKDWNQFQLNIFEIVQSNNT